VDCLKEINDHHGHSEGDFALKESVRLIRCAIQENDQVSRMGGDEFIVMINTDSKKALDQIAAEIDNLFVEYNKASKKGYHIEMSCGADVFDERFHDINQFIRHIDRLMYDQKRLKKAIISPANNQSDNAK
jgi:diguanylate cyclase (GGDEF)-like protein